MRMSTESDSFERQVALQATIAAILYVGEGIMAELHQTSGGTDLERCVVNAKRLITMAENSAGEVD